MGAAAEEFVDDGAAEGTGAAWDGDVERHFGQDVVVLEWSRLCCCQSCQGGERVMMMRSVL